MMRLHSSVSSFIHPVECLSIQIAGIVSNIKLGAHLATRALCNHKILMKLASPTSLIPLRDIGHHRYGRPSDLVSKAIVAFIHHPPITSHRLPMYKAAK